MKQKDFIIHPSSPNELLDKRRLNQDTHAKVTAAHRKVLLDRVVQSMAFDDPSIDRVRLRPFLKPKIQFAMSLSRWNPPANGRLTEAAIRRKLERLGYSVTRYVYPPGTCSPDHSHSVDKMDAVVSGRFKMVMGGKQIILEAGDILAVRVEQFIRQKLLAMSRS